MKMIFKNMRGQEIALGHVQPYWLDRHIGINAGEAQIATFGLAQHGVGVSNIRLRERKIDLLGRITDAAKKSRMMTVCAPKMLGDLLIGERGIRCIVQKCEQLPPEPGEVLWRYALTLLAPFPYFYDVCETTKHLVSWERQLIFPLTLPAERTFIFGTRGDSGQVTVQNFGQVACPCVLRIAARGTVHNPRISIVETGDELAFDFTMQMGDVIEIDTFAKRVWLNGQPNFAILDKRSVFLWLPEGESVIRYAASSGAMAMDVAIRFRQYFIGGIA